MYRFWCLQLTRLCLALWMVLLLNALPASAGIFKPAPRNGVPDVYTVVLAEGVASKPHGPRQDLPTVAQVAQELGRAHGGRVEEVWEHALSGFVIRMPEARAQRLAEDPRVVAVEQDFSVPFSAPVGDCYYGTSYENARSLPSNILSPQTLSCSEPDPLNDPNRTDTTKPPLCVDNWGLDRIDQLSVSRDSRYYFSNNGRNSTTTVHIYVMDTGIVRTHREFLDANNVSRVVGGADARFNPVDASPTADTTDCYGHGTHVAGIIGGRTYGVAKDAILHSVRIIGCSNPNTATFMTAVTRALNWISGNAQRPAVINWSGGNSQDVANNTTIGTAVQGVLNQGITLVQAAGNQSPNYDPAQPQLLRDACDWSFGEKYPGVIIAGGIDEYDGRWTRRPTQDSDDARYCGGDCGSNAGSCVDIWAPSAHIVSSSRHPNASGVHNQACRLSGTSMAAPHVAGVVAMYLEDHPSATATEVERALRSRGTWNVLKTGSDPNSIGPDSDNVLVSSDTLSLGSDLPPVASFTVSCQGQTCNFNASGSTDDYGITSYQWRFGDGTTGSGSTVSHTFPSQFTGRVTLTVTDGLNRADHFSRIVTFSPPPAASFTFSCSRLTCSFRSGSTDDVGIVTFDWSFGDGGTTSDVNPSWTYAATGVYTVTLKVTDAGGLQSSMTRKVSVTSETAPLAESFFTVGPCRILDTRGTNTPLTSGVARTVQVTGTCSIPASAKAVSVNVTVISPTGPGFMRIFPGDQLGGPFEHSTLNYDPLTSPRSNNAILRLATNGAGTLQVLTFLGGSPGQVHMTLDVDGYFSEDTVPAPGAQGPYGFQHVSPCRAGDSRSSSAIAVNTTRNFTVQGVCGVPAGAAAAALNLAVISPTAAGQATLFPAGGTSTIPAINFPANDTLANGARTRLAATTPDLSVRYSSPTSGSSTHALIDVYGYFKSDALLKYRPITACRAVDTRQNDQGGPVLSPGARNFQIRGNCGIPTTAKAVALNITVVGPTGPGYMLVYPAGGSSSASYLNFTPGQGTLANGGIVGLATTTDDLAIWTSTTTHILVDVFGYFR